MMKKYKECFWKTMSIITAIFVIILFIVILMKPYNYAVAKGKINILTKQEVVKTKNSISKENNFFLEKMRNNGQLLTSDEFASRITDYYNSLIATLTALFVLFTLSTYLAIRSKFESKFDLKNIENERKLSEFNSTLQKYKDSLTDRLHKDITDQLQKMLSDSIRVRTIIDECIGGHIDEKVANKEDLDSVTDDIGTIQENLENLRTKQENLYSEVLNLQESMAEKTKIKNEKKGVAANGNKGN